MMKEERITFSFSTEELKEAEELNALWYDPENTWEAVHKEIAQLDELINEFNVAVL